MWFTETAIPPMVVCSAIAAILFIQWYQRRLGKFLIGSLIMVLVTVGFYLLEISIVTPRERVEADLYDLIDAFQHKEQEKTLDYISPRAVQLQGVVKLAMELVTLDDDLRITDVSTVMKAEDSLATIHFRANGTAMYGGVSSRQPTRWELTWQKMGGEWKVTEATRLNPITGETLRPFSVR
ncbi:hypothetical protein [Gimesia sp.]|uniref:hypothetical protein n=1 Tax=Gimesia sp. TaxID=2024833 RepID=UPI003A8D2D42